MSEEAVSGTDLTETFFWVVDLVVNRYEDVNIGSGSGSSTAAQQLAHLVRGLWIFRALAEQDLASDSNVSIPESRYWDINEATTPKEMLKRIQEEFGNNHYRVPGMKNKSIEKDLRRLSTFLKHVREQN